MLIDSNLLQELERNAFSPKDQPLSIYGDPAYPLRIHLQAPFRHGVLTPRMEQYNFDMSSVRVIIIIILLLLLKIHITVGLARG